MPSRSLRRPFRHIQLLGHSASFRLKAARRRAAHWPFLESLRAAPSVTYVLSEFHGFIARRACTVTKPSIEHIIAAGLPRQTSQVVELLIGDAQSEFQSQTITCRLAANFDEIKAAVFAEQRFVNLNLSDMANLPLKGKLRAALKYVQSLKGGLAPSSKGALYLDVRHARPNNISHALNFFVSSALAAQALARSPVTLLTRPIQLPATKSIFDYFCIDYDDSGKAVVGRSIELFLTRGLAAYNALTYFDLSPHSLFREIIDLPSYVSRRSPVCAADVPRNLYISRRGARALENSAEVEALLYKHGYATIFMEDHSIESQCQMAAVAEHVVAIHGAGMGFLALNNKLKSVIEILPPHVYHQFFPTLLASSVQRYIQVMPCFDDRVPMQGWDSIMRFKQQAFALPLNLLERALERAHACPIHEAKVGLATQLTSLDDAKVALST